VNFFILLPIILTMDGLFKEMKFLVIVAILLFVGLVFLYLVYAVGDEGGIDDQISSCIKTANYDDKNFCFSNDCPTQVTTQDVVYCLEDLAKQTGDEKVCDRIGEIADSVYGTESAITSLYKERCQESIS